MKILHPAHPDAKGGGFHKSMIRSGVVFDPATIAIAAKVATIASTAMSVVGAISGAQAQKASLKSQEAANHRNAEILRENAAQANREASANQDIMRQRQRVIRGNQIAGIAESGIGFEGTGGDLVEQSDINMNLDTLSARYEGEMKARGLTYQASQSDFEADVAGKQAGQAMTSGYMQAIGAGIGGVSSYASWQKKYGATTGGKL